MKLNPAQKEELLSKIKTSTQTGKRWKDKQSHFPVEAIVDAILEIPGMKRKPLEDARCGIEGFDTNGWQWDWWQYFSFEGKDYALSGSGYYGGHEFGISD